MCSHDRVALPTIWDKPGWDQRYGEYIHPFLITAITGNLRVDVNLARNEHWGFFQIWGLRNVPKSFPVLPSCLISSTQDRPPSSGGLGRGVCGTKSPEAGLRSQVLTLQDVFIKKKKN